MATQQTHQATKLPKRYEKATLSPTSMPEPMKAGDHSINHPQLSMAIAGLNFARMKSQVKGCQSYYN